MSDKENKDCGTSCGCDETQVDGYWQDVEQKVQDPKVLNQEFSDKEFDSFSVEKTRRNFLKIMGFSVSALPLAGCIKIPVRKALPYLNKQDNSFPGIANWYASTDGHTPILIKTREGRPIKIEGNDKSITTFGGTHAQNQASVLSLYDSNRYRSAMVDGKDVEWEDFDKKLKAALDSNTGEIVIVTPSNFSPSEQSVLSQFSKKYSSTHVAFDAVSNSAARSANEITNNSFVDSEYDFEKANIVVSLEGDFLGTLGNTVANTKQYTRRRSAKHADGMNRHIQVEATMSLTGSNADFRYTRSLADQRDIALGILSSVNGFAHTVKAGNKEVVAQIAKELKANLGKSLVISGQNDVNLQVIINKINSSLGNYNKTIFVTKRSNVVLANDSDFEKLVVRMESGSVGTIMFIGTNPAYNYYNSDKFSKALAKVKNIVSFAMSADETSAKSNYVAPRNHGCESWSDTMV
jgi:molybdopterin-containing oxidoreductase family iron-sulfur binding subunit